MRNNLPETCSEEILFRTKTNGNLLLKAIKELGQYKGNLLVMARLIIGPDWEVFYGPSMDKSKEQFRALKQPGNSVAIMADTFNELCDKVWKFELIKKSRKAKGLNNGT